MHIAPGTHNGKNRTEIRSNYKFWKRERHSFTCASNETRHERNCIQLFRLNIYCVYLSHVPACRRPCHSPYDFRFENLNLSNFRLKLSSSFSTHTVNFNYNWTVDSMRLSIACLTVDQTMAISNGIGIGHDRKSKCLCSNRFLCVCCDGDSGGCTRWIFM